MSALIQAIRADRHMAWLFAGYKAVGVKLNDGPLWDSAEMTPEQSAAWEQWCKDNPFEQWSQGEER